MLRALGGPLCLAVVAACSSGKFEVGSAPATGDSGTAVLDTGTVPGSEDTGAVDSGGRVDGAIGGEAGVADAIAFDMGPPCTKGIPALACPGNVYESHHDTPTATGYLAQPITHSIRHVISFVVQKKGRIEKIGLRLRRTDTGGGTEGTFTVSAFLMPCPESLVPIGKHIKPAGDVSSDTTFYFNPDVTSGMVPYLQWVPAGTRIAFIIETTSTRYTWDLRAGSAPAASPLGFQYGTRTGEGAWTPGGPDALPSTMSYIRTCDGSS